MCVFVCFVCLRERGLLFLRELLVSFSFFEEEMLLVFCVLAVWGKMGKREERERD